MQLTHMKRACAALWILAIAAVGFAMNVTSGFGWIVLAALAVIPVAVMLRLWNVPSKSMSENIRDALR